MSSLSLSLLRRGRRFGRRGLLIAGAAGLVGGCGFRPLYGTTANGETVTEGLQSVDVGVIPDRTGQILRTLLIQRLNPRGVPTEPRYQLTARVTESEERLGVTDADDATRANLTLVVNYDLRNAETRDSVTAGQLRTITSFNILDDEYATRVGRDSARERGLTQSADDLVLRLSLLLNRG